jgi:hypothetical protein
MDMLLKEKLDTLVAELQALPVYVKGPGGRMFAALLEVIDHLAQRVGQFEQARTTEENKR